MSTKIEITENRYFDMLGCVPPIRNNNGQFLVGEVVKHNPKGEPLYDFYYRDEDKYYFGGLMTSQLFDEVIAGPES